MKNLLLRSSLVIFLILISMLLFAPNYLEQELKITFKKEIRMKDGKKKAIEFDLIKDFVQDRENGLRLFFPDTVCEFKSSEKKKTNHSCVLKSRFITAARINELIQANPLLIDDLKTGIVPHAIERFFSFNSKKKKFKNLKIKMGLDLQGGMRVTFKADYESFLERVKEKNQPKKKELEEKLEKTKSQEEKEKIKKQIEDINNLFELDRIEKLSLLNGAQAVITKRLNTLNLSEPEVRVQEDSYTIGVDMPGITNSSDVLKKITDTVSVEYRLVNDIPTATINQDFREEMRQITEMYRRGKVDPLDVRDIIEEVRLKAKLKTEDGRIFLLWRRGAKKTSRTLPREFKVLGPPILDGDDMTGASTNINSNTGNYRINFELSASGTKTFGEVTSNSIGKKLAILWGDRVVSAPVINGPITGGSGVIDGDFDKKESDAVASVIREGALPLPLELISVSFIGPSLGQKSIVAGSISIILGFFLVIIFMIGYYKLSGLIANLVLCLNLLMIAAVLSLVGFTLTLPGFAGVILTVGMAVDANVIIFEKIKEELRLGKSPSISIESGFKSSFWTILDANVTTLIAAIILWKVGAYFDDSAIQGFSITLVVGLLSSMFTALFVSRLIFEWVLYFFNIKNLSIGYGIKQG